jgi:hypothetical protein
VHDTSRHMGGGFWKSTPWYQASCGVGQQPTLRSNTSHAHSPTHNDHMHASVPTLTLLNTHTILMYTNLPTQKTPEVSCLLHTSTSSSS